MGNIKYYYSEAKYPSVINTFLWAFSICFRQNMVVPVDSESVLKCRWLYRSNFGNYFSEDTIGHPDLFENAGY